MKKTLFTTALFLIVSATVFAGGNSNKKTNLFKELSTALNTSGQTVYKTTVTFKGTYFTYNNKIIHAFYTIDDNSLIGFSIPLTATELPAGTEAGIQQKYCDWKISDAMLFIENGNADYYVAVTNYKKQTLVLKLGATGKPFLYAKM